MVSRAGSALVGSTDTHTATHTHAPCALPVRPMHPAQHGPFGQHTCLPPRGPQPLETPSRCRSSARSLAVSQTLRSHQGLTLSVAAPLGFALTQPRPTLARTLPTPNPDSKPSQHTKHHALNSADIGSTIQTHILRCDQSSSLSSWPSHTAAVVKVSKYVHVSVCRTPHPPSPLEHALYTHFVL